MKAVEKYSFYLLIAVVITLTSAFISILGYIERTPVFPYRKAGLTERQAAAHLLNRFTYGATPGEVDKVVKMGFENGSCSNWMAIWLMIPLNQVLNKYDALKLSNKEIVAQYPKNNRCDTYGCKGWCN